MLRHGFHHVATFIGVVYIAFVVNTFSRRIVGWSAATTKETRLVPDALETALRQRDRDGRRPCQTSWYPTAVQEVRGIQPVHVIPPG